MPATKRSPRRYLSSTREGLMGCAEVKQVGGAGDEEPTGSLVAVDRRLEGDDETR